MLRDVVLTAWGTLRRKWGALLATELLFQLAAFALLTPVLTFGVRSLVALSGSPVLSDRDILAFVLTPLGIATLVAAAAGRIAVLALEQACLLGIAHGTVESRRGAARSVLAWGAVRAGGILMVATRLVVRLLALSAPFLGLAALAYFFLLTRYDINYYLKTRPPAFWSAAAVIGSLVLTLSVLLVRSAASWVHALPLLLFENVAPSKALSASAGRARGHRFAITGVFLGWAVVSAATSGLVFFLVRVASVEFLLRFRDSLRLLVPALGVVVGIWVITTILVVAVASCCFAVLVATLYERLGRDGATPAPAPSLALAETDEGAGRAPLRRGQRLVAGLLTTVGLSAAVGWALLEGADDPREVTVIGHRGGAALAPENTLAAVERGIEAGADWLEVDVQETADGEVVVVHDSDFMKLAGSPLKVWEASFDDVRKLDIGSWFGPAFRGERVATLQEVLRRAKGRARVLIELKYYGHDERLEDRIAEIVDGLGMKDEIAVMSLERNMVAKMAALRPDFRKGLLAATALGRLAAADVDFLAVSIPLATPALVREAHRRGRDVYVWTVNDELTMAQQILRNVDGLITDDPGRARTVIGEVARSSPVERLLLATAFRLGVEPRAFRITRDSE